MPRLAMAASQVWPAGAPETEKSTAIEPPLDEALSCACEPWLQTVTTTADADEAALALGAKATVPARAVARTMEAERVFDMGCPFITWAR
ncbi:hypothetical protein BN11_310015 [Nostocoides australiense Ben110]|uniref:Uncharacterized protein n=1 Tax=Nostocoides australiense Ben110 TaxID=1193182 RepID=W6JY33_9MICO|nr:hypothetical protein BN11_310015 [Tetrasphaera australiensis Ben110]